MRDRGFPVVDKQVRAEIQAEHEREVAQALAGLEEAKQRALHEQREAMRYCWTYTRRCAPDSPCGAAALSGHFVFRGYFVASSCGGFPVSPLG